MAKPTPPSSARTAARRTSQTVTKHGKPVVADVAEDDRLLRLERARAPSFADVLLAMPQDDGEFPRNTAPVVLSPKEQEAIARSKAAADRGEFATDEQVRAVWAKRGL
jgi:hypothetical protein